MPFRRYILALVLCVTACAYTFEGSIQDFTVVTPGAQNAVCNVYVDGLRYKFYPPQTTRIAQSKEDLIVDCLAPGNRRKKVVFDSDLSVYGFFNIANAGVGAAWDILSGAMYLYPNTVEIDFRDIPVRRMPMPAHNNLDIMHPSEHNLEEFLPSQPRLNSDRGKPVHKLKRRERNVVASPVSIDDAVVQGKGDLMAVIKDLRTQIDPVINVPSVDVSPTVVNEPGDNAPLPLFPGE